MHVHPMSRWILLEQRFKDDLSNTLARNPNDLKDDRGTFEGVNRKGRKPFSSDASAGLLDAKDDVIVAQGHYASVDGCRMEETERGGRITFSGNTVVRGTIVAELECVCEYHHQMPVSRPSLEAG